MLQVRARISELALAPPAATSPSTLLQFRFVKLPDRLSAPRLVAVAAFGLSTLSAGAGATLSADVTGDRLTIESLVAQAVGFEHGEGVAKDPDRAAVLYCRAARAGSAEAQFRLGWMYANGRGLGRNNRFAASLFALASQQGHEYATRMLGFVGADRAELPACLSGPDEPENAKYRTQFASAENRIADTAALNPEEYEPLPALPFASADRQQYVALVHKLAPTYKVEPALALAIINAESGFDPRAVSPKNAQGLMQLLPETAARFGVRNAFDPAQNIKGGLAYLRWLLAYFRGNVALAAAAYNAGEGTVDRYRGVPPFTETQQYVKKIARYFPRSFHVFDPRATDASSPLSGSRP